MVQRFPVVQTAVGHPRLGGGITTFCCRPYASIAAIQYGALCNLDRPSQLVFDLPHLQASELGVELFQHRTALAVAKLMPARDEERWDGIQILLIYNYLHRPFQLASISLICTITRPVKFNLYALGEQLHICRHQWCLHEMT